MKSDKLAIITPNKEITYLDFEDNIKKTCIWINENIKTKDIAICLSENEEILIMLLACLRLGKNVILLYYNAKENTINIVDESFENITYITNKKNINLRQFTKNCIVNIEEIKFAQNKDDSCLINNINKANIFFLTSGTTSNKSKIIKIPFHIFKKKINMIEKHINMIDEKDRLLILSPICFIQNLWAAFIHLNKHSTIVFDKLSSNYGEKEFQKYNITNFVVSPSVMRGLLKNFSEYNLKLLMMGGDYVSRELIRELSYKFPNTLYSNIYGTTESSAADTILEPQIIDINKKEIFSIGKETELSHITIIKEMDKECLPNEIGEIAIEGECIINSYYNEKKINIKNNGLFYTGDMAYKSEDNYIYFTGRKNYKIISNGINISPFEIEDCVMHSGLVKECIVVGRKDEKYGEVPVACIIPKDEKDENLINKIYEYLDSRLEKYKIPKKIETYKNLEKTDSGKIKRNKYV